MKVVVANKNGSGRVISSREANATGASASTSVAIETKAKDHRPRTRDTRKNTKSKPQTTSMIGPDFLILFKSAGIPNLKKPPANSYMCTMEDMHRSLNLRVASYNIRKTKGRGGKRNPYATLSVINELEADVVALQEADHRLGSRPAALSAAMIAHETDLMSVEVAKNDVSVGWHGNAVLIRKSLPMPRITQLDLPGLEPRGAIILDFEGHFTMVATHLGLTRFHRRAQLGAIVGSLADHASSLILGDFNEWSSSRGLEPLRDGFEVHAPGRTFHAARPVAALDRIAVGKNISLTDAGVMQTEQAKRASDHLPIWADLQLTRASHLSSA